MAPTLKPSLSLSLFILCSLASASLAAVSFRPKALVLPVFKDATTSQYTTLLTQRTPPVPVRLVVDVGGQSLWVDCDSGYSSSTYRPARCRSAQCSLAHSTACGGCNSAPRPGCFNNTCGLIPDNSVTHTATSGQLGSDVVSVSSTDGSNPGRNVTVNNLLFTCAPTFLLKGLTTGVAGMAGLGRAQVGLPSLFASAFSFTRKFAICLPGSSSPSSPGVLFFGPGPYRFLGIFPVPSFDYTPLYINPVSTASAFSQGEASTEYFIGIKSITVGSTTVRINPSLLKIDPSSGSGGTKISTVERYTVMKTPIYAAFLRAYAAEATSAAGFNLTKVPAVKPFGLCFDASTVHPTPAGPSVPFITLNLDGGVQWSIAGQNSMVQVNDNVLCLGFVDGGAGAVTSIVIGGFQLEESLLEFDIARSRFGFSGNLGSVQTSCSNFNFTSNA